MLDRHNQLQFGIRNLSLAGRLSACDTHRIGGKVWLKESLSANQRSVRQDQWNYAKNIRSCQLWSKTRGESNAGGFLKDVDKQQLLFGFIG